MVEELVVVSADVVEVRQLRITSSAELPNADKKTRRRNLRVGCEDANCIGK